MSTTQDRPATGAAGVPAARTVPLITVAHGTRNVLGNETSREITRRAAERLGVEGTATYVELSEPLFADVLAGADRPAVVVPLLLSTGFHMRSDLPEAVAGAGAPVTMGASLGPDPMLAQAQVARLVEAGATRGQRVVLVAAGSSDADATDDQLTAVSLLSRAWDGPVRLATLSGLGERPADVVRPGDVVAPYLLSPGFFHERIAREVPEGTIVADVIGVHECVVQLVVDRATALMASRV